METDRSAIAGLDERARPDAPAAAPSYTYEIYTDGSALVGAVPAGAKAEGPSGWAFRAVRSDGKMRDRSGGLAYSTNNRAELTAAIEALAFLPEDRRGVVRADSQYVVKGMTVWRAGWEAKGFKKVSNTDLWQQLYALADARPGIRFEWVKGHSTNEHNNHVDRMARKAALKMQKE
ncbi:MAG: ribonuclease HI [Methylobacterium mesophilicum]|nr:ribonuclease HI [Methylobacterium mesophilicum]